MTILVVMMVYRKGHCTNTTDILGYADPIAEAECLSCASDGLAVAPLVKGGAEL